MLDRLTESEQHEYDELRYIIGLLATGHLAVTIDPITKPLYSRAINLQDKKFGRWPRTSWKC